MTKRKLITIIGIIYWVIIIYSTISGTLTELAEDGMTLESLTYIKYYTTEDIIASFGIIIFIFILYFFIAMIKNIPFTIIYLGGIVAIKKLYKEKSDITDKKTDKYYRNLLHEYPIAVLGYLKNFEVDTNSLTATILSLQLKNKIIIENKKIKVINKNTQSLDNTEKYILDSLDRNVSIDLEKFKNIVIEYCCKNELLEDKGASKKKLIKKIILAVLTLVIINIISSGIPFIIFIANVINSDIFIIIFLILISSCMFLDILAPLIIIPRIIIYYLVNKNNPYVRSKKAQEVNEKLNGLENYLNDFTIIKERSSNELNLWKDYLIYSIIFNQNNDISRDIINMIEFKIKTNK